MIFSAAPGVLKAIARRAFSTVSSEDPPLDDPRTTMARQELIQKKQFLRQLYAEWYGRILAAVPPGEEAILEIGSGGGFLRRFTDRVITSDLLTLPNVDVVLDASKLPFGRQCLRAIVMTNVLHHVTDARAFFAEADRCVSAAGAVVMLEPWLTGWSRFVYHNLHHEPVVPDAAEWTVPDTGPLSGANTALPWILFERDRELFHRRCHPWRVASLRPLMPLSYLLSGGVSMRGVLPGALYGSWRWIERHLLPEQRCAMFALIVLQKGR